ncbi:DUF6807 domain-containing protein [Chitinophaga vietnamensis]|uniref:DUF6807 domain-containing protein n=1 Tax=Chitinophaga vietnamensis TaxID=2593957 RepID=UPI001375F7E6|nr:PmoA family protein [Chitinophaga vietnamensis]
MKNILLPLALLAAVSTEAQVLARLQVNAGSYNRNNCLVTYKTSGIPANVELEEVSGKKRIAVPVQVQADGIYWILSGHTAAGATRIFELHQAKAATAAPAMMAVVTKEAVVLRQGQDQILQYNTAIAEPPAGSDTVYRRSGFIHPLWAPNGAVLTNIFPNAGHRHHMGIWNPWTHTRFEGHETDFWNVQKKEGKVRFAQLLGTVSGPAWCGFTALQEHVAFSGGKGEKIALRETLEVRAYPATEQGARRLWDMISTLRCASDSGITLLQYRYGGGFGLRTTAAFTAATSQVLTSEGKTRKDADSTRARWVKITGATPQGQAGLLIMNAPDNYDSPEPLRVWPENMEGGELMLNYSPTKMKPWQLTYGNDYTLRYRVMVYNGDITPAEADAAWNDFAFPPQVLLIK